MFEVCTANWASIRSYLSGRRSVLHQRGERSQHKCRPKAKSVLENKLLLLLLRSNPSRQHSQVLYRWGFRRRGKTGKQGKIGGKRKWWLLDQSPYSPQGNWKQSPKVEPFKQGIDHLTRRRTQEAGIIKGWEDTFIIFIFYFTGASSHDCGVSAHQPNEN